MDHRIINHEKKRDWEPEVQKTIKRIGGLRAWDIGANVGFYSKIIAKRFLLVNAVEPDEENYKELFANTLSNRKIILHDYALSDHNGDVELWEMVTSRHSTNAHNERGGSSLFQEMHNRFEAPSIPFDYTSTVSHRVKCVTFDSVEKHSVGLVKIDVEGAEFLVLDGMKEALSNGRIKFLIIELHDKNRKIELEMLLDHYMYHFRWIDQDHVCAVLGWDGLVFLK